MLHFVPRRLTVTLLGCALAGLFTASRSHAGDLAGPDGAWYSPVAPAVQNHAAAYDSRRHRMLIFGGYSPGGAGLEITRAVWALPLTDRHDWSRVVTIGVSPPPLTGASAVYDSSADRLLVFGGFNSAGMHNEVWELSLAGLPTWSQLFPEGVAPAGRDHATMVLDDRTRRVIVFGGSRTGVGLRDTWSLDLEPVLQWRAIATTSSYVEARWRHAAVLDDARRRMLVFGGTAGLYDAVRSVWALSLDGDGVWTQLSTSGSPPEASVGITATLDPARDQVLVLDFWSGLQTFTFTDAGGTWARAPDRSPAQPDARYHHVAVYDPWLHRLVLHGGYANTQFSDAWAYAPEDTASQWSRVAPRGEPAPKMTGHVLVFDAPRKRFLAFGSERSDQPLEAWEYAAAGGRAWRRLAPSGVQPEVIRGMAAVVDEKRDRVLLLCGREAYEATSETWAFSLEGEGAWSSLPVTGTPPTPRTDPSAVYDPAADRVLLFGGSESPGVADARLWELSLAGSPLWSELLPSGTAPAARSNHAAVLDAVGNRMIAFGGRAPFGSLSDVVSLDLTDPPRWDVLATAGDSPGEQFQPLAILDAPRRRMLVGGLENGTPGSITGLWSLALDQGVWRALAPDGLPPQGFSFLACAFDPTAGRLFLHGGGSSPYDPPGVFEWSLDGNAVPVAQVRAPREVLAGAAVEFDGRASHDPDADPLEFSWRFSDGTTAEGPTARHTPLTSGPAVTELHVRDGRGGEDVALVTTLVTAQQPEQFAIAIAIAGANPARGTTGFDCTLPVEGTLALEVFDTRGQLVRTLASGSYAAGRHGFLWDGRDEAGRRAAAGIYFARVRQGSADARTKLVFLP